MRSLIASISIPWYLWTLFGFFIGGILFNKPFRNEVVRFIAHMLNMREKRD